MGVVDEDVGDDGGASVLILEVEVVCEGAVSVVVCYGTVYSISC